MGVALALAEDLIGDYWCRDARDAPLTDSKARKVGKIDERGSALSNT